jgi:quercetin dioxygenase-like cupin family protein
MENTIFPKGEKAAAFFTGTAYVNRLVSDHDGVYKCTVYDVLFEPAARNHWHKHPDGQILLATSGTGYYQERKKPAQVLHKGDVVLIPPNVEHWHGAAPNSNFSHIGISPDTTKGKVEWLGPVTDNDYKEAAK